VVNRAPILLTAVALLAFAARADESAQPVPLGQNLAGETCHASGTAVPGVSASITCGSGADSVGELRVVPLAQAQNDHAAIAALAAPHDGEMTCGDPQWTSANNVLLICTLQSSGWPRIVVGAVAGDRLYRAQGLPTTLPVLEAAIAQASGTNTADADTQAALVVLQAKLPPEVLKASTSDFSSYQQFVEVGRLDGSGDNFAGAEASYRHALEIETRLFGPDSVVVGETLAELALQVSNQGRFDEAAGLFRRASPIIQGSSSDNARARLASYMALDAANQRDFANALKYAQAATAARRAQIATASEQGASTSANGQSTAPPVPANEGELAHSLRIEAEMALRLGDLATAQAAANEALWIVSEEPGLPLWWRADIVSLMGEINAQQNRAVAAERDFRDAVDLNRKLFGEGAPTARAELALGRFYANEQVYPPALEAYRAAFAILAKDPVSRAEIVPDQIVPYFAAANASSDAATKPALDAEMFHASQFVGSDLADRTIARVAAREASGNPALADLVRQAQDAARERDNARVDLAAEYAKADDDRDADREKSLDQKVKLASANADALLVKVGQSFPQYAALSDPGPATLADAQASLRPGEALISFVIGVNASSALLVTQRGLTVLPLKVTQGSLTDEIAELRRAFVPTLGKVPPFSVKTAYSLYQELLAPFEGELAGINHLIVVPGGVIDNLPLSLLVTQAPRDGAEHSYSDAAWLIRRMAVSEVPSPRALLSLRAEREHRQPAPKPFLGIGDPSFSGAAGSKALQALTSNCQEGGVISPDLLRALAPLPDSAHEVEAISARLGGGVVLTGARATETGFRAQPLDQFAVLYFATHGVLPGELRCQGEPGLALSPPDHPVTSTDADGMLSASEIAQLKLNADLVVLAACNTADMDNHLGGGSLEGLADAFFSAGARAVVASHWEVPSQATAKLMIDMFDHADRNSAGGLAQALRQSQLGLISQGATAHPFNWAAFTIIGDGATLSRGDAAAPGAKAAQP
jgi:CHAT domain-containing protein